MTISALIGAWVAAGLTLFMFSFLYKDNVFFKFGEHLYVGISLGYSLSLLVFESLKKKWYEPMIKPIMASIGLFKPESAFTSYEVTMAFLLIVPTILGLLMLTRFMPKAAWLSRYPLAFLVGMGAGMGIPRTVATYFLQQTQATVVPLLSRTKDGLDFSKAALWADFSALIVIVGVISVLIYFFFSTEHKGGVRVVARVGIIFLMISFGASFGYTVMARFSLLFGRCFDLVDFSSKRYGFASPILLVLVIIGVAVLDRRKKEA